MTTTVIADPMASASRAQAGPSPRAGADTERVRVLLVTGLSGAGRATALKVLEDVGYEAVDNLPLGLLEALALSGGRGSRAMAIGFDARSRDFADVGLPERIDALTKHPALDVSLVYLTCSDETLRRRFTETRRRHPLALDRSVGDGILAERQLLAPLQARADLVVDTTDLSIADLRLLLQGHFARDRESKLAISVLSFSYRNGLPREADLVFDVRFLRNPHYEPELRPHTGTDEAVGRFIEADPAYQPFFARLTQLLEPLVPGFEREGKSYLTVAIGCTGGRHRSVFVAERLGDWLRQQGRTVAVRHRDAAL